MSDAAILTAFSASGERLGREGLDHGLRGRRVVGGERGSDEAAGPLLRRQELLGRAGSRG